MWDSAHGVQTRCPPRSPGGTPIAHTPQLPSVIHRPAQQSPGRAHRHLLLSEDSTCRRELSQDRARSSRTITWHAVDTGGAVQASVYPRPFLGPTGHRAHGTLFAPGAPYPSLPPCATGPSISCLARRLGCQHATPTGVCFKGGLGHTVTSWVT